MANNLSDENVSQMVEYAVDRFVDELSRKYRGSWYVEEMKKNQLDFETYHARFEAQSYFAGESRSMCEPNISLYDPGFPYPLLDLVLFTADFDFTPT